MDRRGFLNGVIGCSLAASPLVTPLSFASVPGQGRLVVILLRGGMDGLGTVAPVGDPGFATLRGTPGDLIALDGGMWAAHRGLERLMPLWQAGELSFVHAVSTPYRDKRSHFDGQDLLEAGGDGPGGPRDGWLNRMAGLLPNVTAQSTYALGNGPLAIASGAQPITRWSPDSDLALSPQAMRLAHLIMADDPAMADALARAFDLADSDGDAVAMIGGAEAAMDEMMADMKATRGRSQTQRVAEFAGKKLRKEASVACFSINGWDSHAQQDRVLGRALDELATAMLTLKEFMGDKNWQSTVVAAVTEFGRTARINGTGGTDHGTGGAMILGGGALKGGRVITDWPGLARADLYAGRDLMPTRDLRAHLGWLIRGLYGLSVSDIEQVVFPGVELGADPGLLG